VQSGFISRPVQQDNKSLSAAATTSVTLVNIQTDRQHFDQQLGLKNFHFCRGEIVN